MGASIIRQFEREVSRAFLSGRTQFKAYGKVFRLEKVTPGEYRVTSESGDDIGLRFTVGSGVVTYIIC